MCGLAATALLTGSGGCRESVRNTDPSSSPARGDPNHPAKFSMISLHISERCVWEEAKVECNRNTRRTWQFDVTIQNIGGEAAKPHCMLEMEYFFPPERRWVRERVPVRTWLKLEPSGATDHGTIFGKRDMPVIQPDETIAIVGVAKLRHIAHDYKPAPTG